MQNIPLYLRQRREKRPSAMETFKTSLAGAAGNALVSLPANALGKLASDGIEQLYRSNTPEWERQQLLAEQQRMENRKMRETLEAAIQAKALKEQATAQESKHGIWKYGGKPEGAVDVETSQMGQQTTADTLKKQTDAETAGFTRDTQKQLARQQSIQTESDTLDFDVKKKAHLTKVESEIEALEDKIAKSRTGEQTRGLERQLMRKRAELMDAQIGNLNARTDQLNTSMNMRLSRAVAGAKGPDKDRIRSVAKQIEAFGKFASGMRDKAEYGGTFVYTVTPENQATLRAQAQGLWRIANDDSLPPALRDAARDYIINFFDTVDKPGGGKKLKLKTEILGDVTKKPAPDRSEAETRAKEAGAFRDEMEAAIMQKSGLGIDTSGGTSKPDVWDWTAPQGEK